MLILFDIDGTLLRGGGAGREATRAAMLEVFGTASAIDIHKFGGKTDWYTLIELLEPHGITREQVAAKLGDFERSLARHTEAILPTKEVITLPGALEAVTALRQRDDVILGVVTGNTRLSAPFKLKAAGFDPAWFPVGAFGSEAIERNDLPPLALQRAIDTSGRALTPSETVIIGDTVADIEAAQTNGMRVIAVTTGYASREELAEAQPDHLLDDLTTVLDVLI